MLTLLGRSHRYCDGISRRSFLTAGSLLLGGLTLPRLLQAEQRAGRTSNKSVIMIYLAGGIGHQDSFDLKPEAPDGIRGEFKPIDTAVPGIRICELLPQTAAVMDRISLVRSIIGLRDEHSSFQNLTGYPMGEANRDGRPNFGSVVSQVLGPRNPVIPPYIDMFPTMVHRPYNIPGPGYLGPQFAGVRADGEDLASMKLRYVSQAQFDQRRQLLQSMDRFRREIDDARVAGVETSYDRAFDVLSSGKLVDALDIEKEDPAVRNRYGRGTAKPQGDAAPLLNEQFLAARRLIEVGVRCVSIAYGFWDFHGGNFPRMKFALPQLDQGVAALVTDLYERGLDKDVTLLVWGEFGRTPKINANGGRDHWPRVSGALFSGGGLQMGQVIGSTDAIGGAARERPVHYLDVLATLYTALGIDPHEFIKDQTDRPISVLPGNATPIRELF